MYFLMSNQAYDQDSSTTRSRIPRTVTTTFPPPALPATFSSALQQDLAGALVNGKPQLTIYIHGLEVTFGNAVQEMASLGSNLAQSGPYSGLVIGFSWPSGDVDALNYATTWPAQGGASGTTVRDNIVNSVQAFITLLQVLQNLVPNLSINIICHSEGNYMLMRGMAKLSGVSINQVIMLAADISNAALQLAAANNGGINGQAISTLSNNVTVYSSIYDEDVLYSNLGYLNFHNKQFPLRLGQTGVYSYLAVGGVPALPGNVAGVDCSAVVNDGNIINLVNQGIIQAPGDAWRHIRYKRAVHPFVVQVHTPGPGGHDGGHDRRRSRGPHCGSEHQWSRISDECRFLGCWKPRVNLLRGYSPCRSRSR